MTTSRPFMLFDFYVNTPILGSNSSRPLGNTGFLIVGAVFLDSIFGVPPELELANQAPDSADYNYDYGDYQTRYDTDYQAGSSAYPSGYNGYYYGYSDYQPIGYQDYYYPAGESSYSYLGPAGARPGEPWTEPRPHVVLGEARSLAEDQMTIYQQLQSSLSAVGVDGRSCLLRFICEAQHRRMQRLNLLGQMLATLLTPKEDDFLASYSEAAAAGREGSCLEQYSECPVSLFTLMDYAAPSSKSPKGKRRRNKLPGAGKTSRTSRKMAAGETEDMAETVEVEE